MGNASGFPDWQPGVSEVGEEKYALSDGGAGSDRGLFK